MRRQLSALFSKHSQMENTAYTLVIHRIDNFGNDHILRADTESLFLAESCYELNLGMFAEDHGCISWLMVLYIHFNGESKVIRSNESDQRISILNLAAYLKESTKD